MSEVQSILELNRKLQNNAIEFAREESWTPVDGALLLSGIRPSERFDNAFESYQWGVEFPIRFNHILLEIAFAQVTPPFRALEGGNLPERSSRFYDAISILKRWDDHCCYLLEDGRTRPSKLTPHAFVQWWLEEDEGLEDTRFQQAIVDVLFHRVPPKSGDNTVYEFKKNAIPFEGGGGDYVPVKIISHALNRPELIVPKKNQGLSVSIGKICLSVYRDHGNPYDLGLISEYLLRQVKGGEILDVTHVSDIKAGQLDDCGFVYRQSGKEKTQTWGALRKLLGNIKKKNNA
ncbi:protein of unknown function [Burkholderia multivorans]